MRTLHLCAGHGGGLLASLILGHPIVGAVEYDAFAQSVLRARQRDGLLPAFSIHGDLRTFDGRGLRGSVDLVAGGIPCQGFSGTGKGLGEFDPRNLWPDALRVLRETRAPWFFLENVANLTSFDYWGVILQDLAAAGYDARWCLLAAGDVGAPHLRKRIWLLATDTDAYRQPGERGRGDRELGGAQGGDQGQGGQRERLWDAAGDVRAEMADADQHPGQQRRARDATEVPGGRDADRGGIGQDGMGDPDDARLSQRQGERGDACAERAPTLGAGGRPAQPDLGGVDDGLADRLDGPGWWAVERGLPRVAGKQPNRADRLRGCGNGQVALCAAAAYRLLGGP